MAATDQAYDSSMDERTGEAIERIRQQLAEGSARVAQQRAQWQAVLRELKLARAAANDSSWELADLEQRLRELNEQREGPGDPLLEREIAQLTMQRMQLEERVLTLLLLVDELIERAEIEQQALALAQEDWAVRETALLAEHDGLGGGRV